MYQYKTRTSIFFLLMFKCMSTNITTLLVKYTTSNLDLVELYLFDKQTSTKPLFDKKTTFVNHFQGQFSFLYKIS